MKGQWRTVEAILSGVAILMFVAAMWSTGIRSFPAAPSQGYRALGALYESGSLRPHAAAMDCASVSGLVSGTGYMSGYNHTVSICNSSACCGQAPEEGNVWTSSLLVAGDGSYGPVEVILYITR